uniref:Uncharacterized protein n=1 Tax=Streptomyces rochei TaxID=1928 RepID=F2Z8Q3_STRRO|nr:hypothetical protein [Streptomyces rochei]
MEGRHPHDVKERRDTLPDPRHPVPAEARRRVGTEGTSSSLPAHKASSAAAEAAPLVLQPRAARSPTAGLRSFGGRWRARWTPALPTATAPGIGPPGLSRTCMEAPMQISIARNNGDSDTDMDEALRRVRQGK